MSKNKKQSACVKRLSQLKPEDIMNNIVTCINVTVVSEKDGKLEFEGSWKELIKALLWLTYQSKSKYFTGALYDAKVVDGDFQIYREPVGAVRNGKIVYAEQILGTPYYIDYDYSHKTMFQKIIGILGVLDYKPKDVLLTLKPI